jgi:uncharacterized protein (TIGR02118 family)
MYKIVVLYPPQPDPEAFKKYYTKDHMPLVRKMPGIKNFRYSFNLQGVGGPAPFFCIFEAEFADGAAAGAAMQSPEGMAVANDVPNFAKVAPTLMHFPVDGGM